MGSENLSFSNLRISFNKTISWQSGNGAVDVSDSMALLLL